jgi:hypothetical protein
MPIYFQKELLYKSSDIDEAEEILRGLLQYVKAYKRKCQNKGLTTFKNLDEPKTGEYFIYILYDKAE